MKSFSFFVPSQPKGDNTIYESSDSAPTWVSFGIFVDTTNAKFPIVVDPLSHYKSIAGTQSGSSFGYSVAFANVSNKSTDDIIVGAPNYDGGQSNEGAVFVFHGTNNTTPPSSTSSWSAEGNEINAKFGYSVANAGQVDGGTYDAIIVGAPNKDGSYTDDGQVFIFEAQSGGGGLNYTPDLTISGGSANNDKFGFSVNGAGDVDNDGYTDVIVGAPYYGTSDTGKVFVYYQ